MQVDLQELRNRAEYINCQQHPTLPLLIWGYSQRCQFDKAWDEYTLMARGLITDLEGNIVARPFKKFFNLGETEETKMENLPAEVPLITEKLDGSLGILYFDDDGLPCIATRGSFSSEQAVWATKWIQAQAPVFGWSAVPREYTYLFEIIYKENRIVVDYDFEGLVLLAIINNTTGENTMSYASWNDGNVWGHCATVSKVKRCGDNIKDIIETLKTVDANTEGYVVRYSNGLMLKMKGAEYVRLHRLITGFSSYSIWDCLKNGQDIDAVLEKVPDEFYQWVKNITKRLNLYFNLKMTLAEVSCELVKLLPTRKDQADAIQDMGDLRPIVFSLLDGKRDRAAETAWKLVKPAYELPFKKDDEAS